MLNYGRSVTAASTIPLLCIDWSGWLNNFSPYTTPELAAIMEALHIQMSLPPRDAVTLTHTASEIQRMGMPFLTDPPIMQDLWPISLPKVFTVVLQ